MSDVYDRLASLPPEKRELLLRQLRQKQAATNVVRAVIPRRPRDTDLHPMSFAQQRLWLLDQLDPNNAFYNIPVAIQLTGALDVPTLQRCFNELLRRHESLRTTLRTEQGQPVQVIAPQAELTLETVDLRNLPTAQHDAEVRRLAIEEARKPFDLQRGPLLRASLLRLAEQDFVLLLTMHHVVSDGWSMGVLVREMGALYASFVQGKPSPMMELAVQYVDYASWQREWLRGDVLTKQLDYWRKQLEGVPQVLELPTDKPRPPRVSFKGAGMTRMLPKGLSESIKALAQKEGVTPFMVLLAAFQVLMARNSGQNDFMLGSPIAGRHRGDVEGLIGFFVNTLVLRARVSPQQSFRELLAQVKEMTLGAYANQDIPFEQIVEELKPERDQSRTPLFQVMFAVQNAPVPELALPGLKMKPLAIEGDTSKFDLTVTFTEQEEGFIGEVEYSTDLYELGTVQRMLEQMQLLLEGIVSEPNRKIRELSIQSAAERQQVLVDWNATRVDYPRDASIPSLFEAQVERTPDSIAIEYQGQTLTYRELNKRANQLAHHLRASGVGPEVRVGLCLERSLELVVGILGILKAGGAYVPLDPSYPADRLSFMLQDTGVKAIVTQKSLAHQLPAQDALFLCLDTDWSQVAVRPEGNVSSGVSAGNVAYIMYTSGSTGRPKGVCVPHRGVVRLVKGSTFIDLGPQEVFLQLAPISFDASTLELWGALLHGAKLVVYPAGTPSLDELGASLVRNGITTLWLTAALFEQMQATQPQSLRHVRQLLAGGDVLPVGRVKERLSQGGVLVNGYGPTENTTFTCCYPMRELAQVGHSVSIGKPIASTQVYLLDASMQPVPVGVAGELYTGGDGLAVGYLNRPELTAEKFVPHPFSTEPGARLYRTGDLARYLPGGRIEFLGRRDAQVKVRGFRIELGEIESVLAQHVQVRETVVVVREDVPGDKRLVAYVTAKDTAPESGALRAWMKERLPEYMVPPAYVVLESLPLSPNGKVDRKALPAPDGARSDKAAFEAPRTETEVKLAEIWRALLGVERVGLNDDFFELGGHSLLATQVVVRAREAFQVEVPLRNLFDAPTLAGLAERIDAALGTGRGAQAPAITRASREGVLPLSFAQQRLWFLDQLQPGSSFYNVPMAVKLEGSLDVAALENGLNGLVQRHESLRTTFATQQDQPVQIIASHGSLPLQVVDLSAVPSAEREAEIRRLTTQEALKPFDLGRGPVLRALLLRLEERQHVLMLTMHHIVSDGWSMGVLVRELAALYEASTQGRPSPLPELPVQYADYAAWQRGWFQGEVLEQQLGWWRQRLADAPRALELPTDKPRPAVQTYRGAICRTQLPLALSQSLKTLAQKEGATPFMVLLAAFQVLMSRYSGQDDISVGSPIAGRNRGEVEGLIGFFVNTLVLRSRISGQRSFRELLAQVKEMTLGAYAHQEIPFEKLVEEIQPERDQSRSPLFQVMFAVQNAPMPELASNGLKLSPLALDGDTAKYDLSLGLQETAEGFAGDLEYNTDLFEASTARRMLEQLQVLLEGIVSAPDRKLRELSLLGATERQQVLTGWNQTHTDFPRQHSIHQLFEDRARLHPEAVALEFGETQLTYAQLDTRANQLAHFLAAKGVRSGDLVGICVERSADLVVGLLGILKAGAAYVPLDPSYPQQRLAFMLEDTQARVVVAQRHLVSSLPLGDHAVVCLDEELHLIGQQSAQPLSLSVDSMQAAYVIYTSGSTGRPKGVCVPHQAVVRLVRNTNFIELNETDRVGQASNASFDAATFELWGALLNGARVVGVPKDIALEARALGEHLERTRINVLFVTTALFNQVARERPQSFSGLRQLHFGGEASDPKWVREVLQKGAPGKLLHVYGPTESTTFATWYLVEQVGQTVTTVPIGGALSNTTLYVLDRNGLPAPVGVPGELYIGGEGLAWGYLHRPELTAEKFVPHPFSTQPGERLYRTGDVVRWLPEGSLEFVGRVDSQVKVRGFRIELGEVESALVGYPGVGEAVVMVREDSPGDRRLVGYVVAREGQGFEVSELKSYLKEKLPDYMVPAALVKLDKLPLNPNGKVDRKALPVPDQAQTGQEYVAPRNETERLLAQLWAEVLRVPRVGIHDNFFDLGGHSLLATQVLSRIRSTFQVELPLRSLFEASTLAALALKLDEAIRAGQGVQAPALTRVSRDGHLPLSFAQQRLWFLDQLEPGSAFYNVPTAVKLEGTLDAAAIERALSELVRRHESLRTTFSKAQGQPAQIIAPDGTMPLEVVDLGSLPSAEREAEVHRLTTEHAMRPFDLHRGPLVRALLLRLEAQQHVLMITLHHIISDGWSLGVLVREVAALYEAFSQDKPSPLPEMPVQYADYAAWQRGWLQGEVLEQQLEWWRQQLADAPRVLELPTDKPRPPVQTHRGATSITQLPLALTQGIKALAQKEGATPFMVILAAFQVLLSRSSGQQDICVGSPIAGRNQGDVEGLIGFFVNTLVLRSKLSPQQSFRELLAQVRDTTLGAYAHQEVPFEKLVEELQPERDLSRSPLFQVSFTFENTPQAELALPGLTLRPVMLDNNTAKFDLSLGFQEMADGFAGELAYNVDLFEASTAQRMLAQLQVLLEGVVANPEQQLRHLPLLTESERSQLLVDWNATRVDYPREASIPALFEAQVERTPDSIAIEYQGETLTYRELNKRANQLAHHLRAFGVGPESRVGLCLERSLELVVGILGILKAGGAYVPLDPSYPADRLSFMLQDTGVMVIVTQESLADELPAQGALFVCLDADWDQVTVQPEDNVASGVTAENVAYIMYTSGSTGRPKGVCVPHRGVVRLVKGSTFIDMGPQEVFLQLAPISFDASTLELWGALLHGAKLVVYPAGTPSLDELGASLARNGITTLWLTAALFEQMQATQAQSLRSVRQLLAGGDVLPVGRVKERLAQGSMLVNGYGPTENTTFTCCYSMRELAQVGHSVSIGKPIASTQVYLLDASMQPVPVGVAGELYTGGDGLAVGYLNRPELTAEKFVPHPFSTEPGARLYRTGDLARYLPDGRIEFFGRRDAQVKVRGFRIELGEIETVLTQHAQVREAVVVVREDVPGDKRLVAYVTAKDDAPDTTALRAWMKERLPEYMVPPAYVVLETLPLSPNGKVDRKALPTPDGARSDDASFEAPRTDTEVKLAEIWRSLLGVERVGLNDDFFELGGHSLLATQVVVRVREVLQVEIALRELFDSPTLSGLAGRIDATSGTSSAPQAPALERVSREGQLPLSFAQQRLWFLDQLQPGSAFYNIPILVRLDGRLDVDALRRSFEELVQRHESLRTTFGQAQGQPVQLISPQGSLPLQVVDLLSQPSSQREAEIRRLAMEESLKPFDLGRGPLLRVLLMRQEEQSHVLLLTMHHIVSDGWSMGVLVREIAALYAAFTEGKASPLPELPVQYADYAAWQRGWLQGEMLEQQLGYWRQQLADAPRALALPTDKPRPPVQTDRGATATVQLPLPLSQSLKALGHEAGATPFMVLLAAFQVLLSRYSGQDDISVGSAIAGRHRGGVDGLIGFFVNTLVLRSRISGQRSFRELLAQVRDTTLGAYAHQDVPFEKLVEELQPERDLSRTPLFQVSFAMLNAPMPELATQGLKLSPLMLEGDTAKYDLSLGLTETDEGFSGALDYNTDLYEAPTIQRLLGHLRVLLEGIVAAPDRKLQDISLLGAEERQRVLMDWNQTRTDFPRQHSIPQLFAERVRLHPEAVALEFGETQLTYGELDTRTHQLAHYLASKGVRSGDLVCICAERSADLVVGMLGILKAGAAYVPLDAAYPQQRLAFMLEDTRARVVVTQRHLVQALPLGDRTVVCLDEDLSLIRQQPSEPLARPIDAAQAAYVIYTSGSTGKPKGVCVPHLGVARLVRDTNHVQYKDTDRVAQGISSSFDPATLEIWGALLNGARLVGVPKEVLLSSKALGEHLERTRINAMILPTAVFNQMGMERPGIFSGLRYLIAGGEAMDPKTAREVLSKGAPGTLVNAYGPTESTVMASWHRVEQVPPGATHVPIGVVVSNTTLYVLDRNGQPVPVGVPGELYIGGEGLAWGYLHRPELTAERFVPNPFSSEPGERLYRTGDIVRWLPWGGLEFFGRVDAQVKVRGYRIELGEVEAALLAHPSVGEAVVLVREDSPGDKRLVGYVAPREGQDLEVATLKADLKEKLPDYMVPAALVKLDKLPLTPNGKVDRKALPMPEREETSHEYVAPRNDTEERLAQLWAEVLHVSRVGVHENFFDLGGHSLLATQVLSRIREAFQVELPLRVLFEATTVAMLALKVEEAVRAGQGVQAPAITRVSRDGHLPLSFAQQRLWFLDQLEPGSAFYNMPTAVKLEGSLDVAALERALSELVRRHESLRTTFSTQEGQPVQVIAPHGEQSLPVVDLSTLPASEQEDEVRRLSTESALKPFDLGNGPLLRTLLLRLDAQQHVLVITQHHILSDGWSMGVLVREVATLYAAFTQGKPSPLPELPVQYADYAAWQRGWLQGEVLEQQLGWWRQQLADAPRALELPTDRPRPPVQTHNGATSSVQLPLALSQGLKALAQKEGATPFMVLLAAFQVLLSRYSGQDDISVGSPIAGRNRGEVEGLIGFFINTLVLRARVSHQRSFRELLAQVRDTTLGAYAHQEVPFEKLVEELQPERDLSRSPLFQVLFTVQNAPMPEQSLPGLTLRPLALEGNTAKFDLTLGFMDTEQGFAGELEYNTDLYESSTIQHMLGHLRVLLEGIVAAPERKLWELSPLDEAERRQLLVDWSEPLPQPVGDTCLHHLVEAQVERTPDAIAVISGTRRLTYRELERRSNQLAHRLRQLGVGPEVKVGVCLERTEHLVLAVLSVLKAGGTYVPLDPAYPQDRLGYMLQETRVPVLLTQRRPSRSLPEHSAHVVLLDEAQAELDALPSERFRAPVHPGNLAYVLYTSGSTGRPKGVSLEHRNAVAFIHWARGVFSPKQLTGVLAATSLNFDLSVFELFAPLSSGGAVIVAENALALPTIEARDEVTLVNTVPSAMAELVRSQGVPTSVRTINLAGEPLTGALAKLIHELPHVDGLYNLYGPTEDTTYSTYVRVSRDAQREPTIGKPLAGTQGHVLDARMQLVPVGVPGELYLGGAGLARGYLHRPELAAERFVPNPFSTTPGERLYRTGDRVRYLPDGELEYLGRIDNQVKVRGFRIELGEIETALRGHPGVRDVVVVAREDSPGDKRLVAYLVAKPEHTLAAAELRTFLKQSLPEYMVPSALMVLDKLPLSPNGKVDRKALPVPDQAQTSQEYVAPRNETEQLLAQLWSEVLKAPRIGVHENFFELGGHSLLATQVLSRIRTAFRVELPLRDLFEAPTIATLATRLDAAVRAGQGVQAPALVRVPRDGQLPLSFAQQRLWFLDQLQPGGSFYNMPTAVRLEGTLDVAALERALSELVRRHESLRTTFAIAQGEPVQVIAPHGTLPLEVVDLSAQPASGLEAEVRRLSTESALKPFDLGSGPLLRALLLRLDAKQHVLVVTMHHVVSDGWSLGVLVREVAALYQAFSEGKPSPLPELPVQYADYAAWQRGWLQGEVLEQQLGWWRQQLAGAPRALELPTDRPRPPVMTHRGGSQPVVLSAELSRALMKLCQRENVTPFMLLLAAFQVLLSRYSGQDDISVGSPIAGRNRGEVESLIGFFVNTLVLRTRLSPQRSFRALLAQVRETTLGAYAHQEVPFEKLVEELQPERDLSRSALFQVMLTFQNTPTEALESPGLTLRPLEVEAETARFELSLTFAEDAGALSGQLRYNADLFDARTAARMAGHLSVLLEGAVADPEQSLGRLPLLTSEERRQLLVEWNDTRRDFTVEPSLPAAFEAQVARTPEALALMFEGTQLTFRELNQRANQLAHLLRARGIGPNVLVAMCLERSLEQVVAVFGILKAGGAYVPLDPAYPQERLNLVLTDSQAPVLLTQRHLLPRLQSPTAQVLCLDAEDGLLARQSVENPPLVNGPEDLAYVIYTSGSTGVPKGVMIQQGSVLNLHHALANTVYSDVRSPQRVSLNAPLSFDASVKQLVRILDGHALCMVPETARGDVDALLALLARDRVDVLDCSPSHLRLLLSAGLATRTENVPTRVLVGGEALDEALWTTLSQHPRTRFFNVYGPTECTVDTTACEVRDWPRPTLGKLLPNVRGYVLDERMQPVPVGVPGELYVGGAGVARGYLRRPELTSQKFVADPFSARPGARLYRTGDLVRWLPDGTIDYLGRVDFQVKVRGFRIELEEIEAVLSSHPGVQQATVVAREDTPGDKRLVAYLVARDGQPFDLAELRGALRQKLPEYMVPSAFVALEKLPLNSSGKVDRKALPAPEQGRIEAAGAYVPPRDALELQVARIWEEVLDVRPVGATSHFFELGGHSLLAVRLMGRLREVTGRSLPLAALFQAPTVEQLAQLLRGVPQAWSPLVPLVPVQPGNPRRPLFVVHPVGGTVLGYSELARQLGPRQPFYALESRGLDGSLPPCQSVEEMAALYVDAIRTVQPSGPYLLGGWSMGGVVAYEMAQQLQRQGEQVELVMLIDSQVPSGRPANIQNEDEALQQAFVGLVEDLIGNGFKVPEEQVKTLGREELLHVLMEGARKAQLALPEVGVEQVRALRNVFEANLRASWHYRPAAHVGGPLTLLRASKPVPGQAEDRGWGTLAPPGKLDIHEVPGAHFELLQPPAVQAVAERLREYLERAHERASVSTQIP
ncbi:non-ribosomal peptide synthetase [Archangium violaceum]|uniref:non-ribosomal peptide synthetase n=1 Tax=Archangium violaceum TaxID=83451 RepID=UPI0036D7BB4F